MFEIATGDELVSLLISINEIERDLLFKLMCQFETRKSTINYLISMINASHDFTKSPIIFIPSDSKNNHELEITEQLSNHEKLTFYLYNNLFEALKKSDIKQLLRNEDDVDFFMSSLKKVVSLKTDSLVWPT